MTLGTKHATTIQILTTTFYNNKQKYRTAVQLITAHCDLNKLLNTNTNCQ